jgi:hypothetical protein
MNFREAKGRELGWENTGLDTGFSNFLFVDKDYGSDPVLRRVLSLARKNKFQSLLIEEIAENDCALLQEENDALRIRRPDFKRSIVHRLSFFKNRRQQAPGEGAFLGYVIFKQDLYGNDPKLQTHIYESVTVPCRGAKENNYIHCHREFAVNTSRGRFKVNGVLYAQQNDLTFVCAHVALRSVLACMLPEGDITYSKINNLLGIDHRNRKVGGHSGLGPEDIEFVFNQLGVPYEKVVHEPKEGLFLVTDFQRDLYGFIESGFPALVGFESDEPKPRRHIIPVFGHTFNEDTWLPNAQRAYFGGKLSYYPSENWLSTFVVHDDNFGPYFCLPRHFLRTNSLRSVPLWMRPVVKKLSRLILRNDSFRLMYGLKTAPACYGAVDAEAAGFDFFRNIANQFGYIGQDSKSRQTDLPTSTGRLVHCNIDI